MAFVTAADRALVVRPTTQFNPGFAEKPLQFAGNQRRIKFVTRRQSGHIRARRSVRTPNCPQEFSPESSRAPTGGIVGAISGDRQRRERYGFRNQSLHRCPPEAGSDPLSHVAQLASRAPSSALAALHQRYSRTRQAELPRLRSAHDFAQGQVRSGSRQGILGLQQFPAVFAQTGFKHRHGAGKQIPLQRMNAHFEKGQHWITPQQNHT